MIDFFVMGIVAFPPFFYLHRYIDDRIRNIPLRFMVYILYWGAAFLYSSLMPSIAVLLLIWRSTRERGRLAGRTFGGGGGCAADTRSGVLYPEFAGEEWRFSADVFFRTALVGIPIKIAVTYANSLIVYLLELLKVPLENQQVVNDFMQSEPLESISYIILIVVCAPIAEEFVFRFFIYRGLLKFKVSKLLSALLSSLLFMGAHFNIQGAGAFFLIGMINCYLYDRRGYWAAVANHFMFNFSSIIVLLLVKYLNIPLDAL